MTNTKLTPQQVNGRKGGLRTVKKYGKSHMRDIASLGGSAVVELYGPEHMSNIGQLGNQAKHNHLSKTREKEIRREINRTVANA